MLKSTLKSKDLSKPSKSRQAPSSSPPDREDASKKFICSEESENYALSLQKMLFNALHANCLSPTIIEFGSGTGEPIISAILNSGFTGIVHGYEINLEAACAAQELIASCGLTSQYIIHTESFFSARDVPQADYLIANPPYIPADNKADLLLPGLCGGSEGNSVAKRLLSASYTHLCLEVSSYSNPAAQIQHAQNLGYSLTRFSITELPLGIYSRQPVVIDRIRQMQQDGKAFLGDDHYSVGSAFFTKRPENQPDLSLEFFAALTNSYAISTPYHEANLPDHDSRALRWQTSSLARLGENRYELKA